MEYWPHAPKHELSESGTYYVTASTYGKVHHFRGKTRLGLVCRGLLELAHDYNWTLEAWAVFSNHYHFVAHSPENEQNAKSLKPMLRQLHTTTASWINKRDGALGRKVWHNYRDTQLTYQKSYLARLNYVHQNPVKHGLVPVANQYPWCSAGWFEREATPAQVKTIYGVKIDHVNVYDDFDVDSDW